MMNESGVKLKHTLTRKQRDRIFVALMLLLPTLQFVVFWIVPNFNSILMAFRQPNSNSFNLLNFQRFFREVRQENNSVLPSLRNTVIQFLVGNFINLPMVLFMSYVLFKKIAGYRAFRVIFYLPAIIGASVTAALFRYLVSNNGPIEQLLDHFGVNYSKQLGLLGNPDTAFTMIIIYGLWTGVGVNMIMFLGAMNRIPEDIFEAAKIDGIGFWRTFFQIVCPLIWPTVTTMLIFGMSGIFTSYGGTMLLAPNVPEASTIGWYIVKYTVTAGNGVSNEIYNYPAAVGLIFTFIGFPLVMLVKWLCDRVARNVEY